MSSRQRPRHPRRPARPPGQRRQDDGARSPLRQVMTYAPLMLEVDAAEARGDAADALEGMRSVSQTTDGRQFWRPWRVRTLTQMAELGPVLPGWATSRWVAEQAVGRMAEASSERTQQALTIATELRGGVDALPGVDEADALARVVEHDWAFRQLHLFDLGGLEDFLDNVASPELIAAADGVRAWPDASLTVCRLLERDSAIEIWWDCVHDRELAVPNLGAAATTRPGESVLTRVMPVDGGAVFDGVGLGVADELAERLAADPSEWLATLRWARDLGYRQLPHLARSSVLSDLSEVGWQSMFMNLRNWSAPPGDPGHLSRAVLRTARLLVDGGWPAGFDEEEDLWSPLGAAIVEPGVASAVRARAQGDDVDVLEELADRLAAPYSRVCAQTARSLREAA